MHNVWHMNLVFNLIVNKSTRLTQSQMFMWLLSKTML